MSEEKQTVAGAYAKMSAHEDLCAERYDRINETLSDLKMGAKWIIGLLVALLGWFAIQVWDGQKAAIAAAAIRPAAEPVVASPRDASFVVATKSVGGEQ